MSVELLSSLVVLWRKANQKWPTSSDSTVSSWPRRIFGQELSFSLSCDWVTVEIATWGQPVVLFWSNYLIGTAFRIFFDLWKTAPGHREITNTIEVDSISVMRVLFYMLRDKCLFSVRCLRRKFWWPQMRIQQISAESSFVGIPVDIGLWRMKLCANPWPCKNKALHTWVCMYVFIFTFISESVKKSIHSSPVNITELFLSIFSFSF